MDDSVKKRKRLFGINTTDLLLLDEARRRVSVVLNRQPEGRYQVVMGPHRERPVPVVGIRRQADLVAHQLLGQGLRLGSPGQVEPVGLEEELEAGDEVGLAEANLLPVGVAAVAVGEVDGHHLDRVGVLAEEVDEGLAVAGRVEVDAGAYGAALPEA